MAISRSKVVIIGAGNVGTTLAHQMVVQNMCNDLALIDLNQEKVWAEVTDLKHSLGYSETGMRITVGSYEDCGNADIVVLAVAAPYREGMTRMDMLDKAASIVTGITKSVMKSGFHGIFVVITNPVDAISYLVQKVSGLPEHQVIGTGTSLDSARLRQYLADTIQVDARSVDAFCMGEHGDSQFIPWSRVTVGSKPFTAIVADSAERFGNVNLADVGKQISQIAYKIVKNKGATNYGIASVAAKIIKAILNDENAVMPVSTMLHGEYGEAGIYIGVPAVLTARGVKELVEYHLTDEEMEAFHRSADYIRQSVAGL